MLYGCMPRRLILFDNVPALVSTGLVIGAVLFEGKDSIFERGLYLLMPKSRYIRPVERFSTVFRRFFASSSKLAPPQGICKYYRYGTFTVTGSLSFLLAQQYMGLPSLCLRAGQYVHFRR